MKKILIAIFITITTATSALGAVSEDMSVYVRKDLFDVKMDAFMTEIRGEFQVVNAKLEALSRRIDDNYHSLDTRISDVRNDMYLGLVILGIIVTLPMVQKMLQGREEQKDVHKAFVTLEDVRRLIEENNVKLNSRTQA